jgi:hypothetical protein
MRFRVQFKGLNFGDVTETKLDPVVPPKTCNTPYYGCSNCLISIFIRGLSMHHALGVIKF